MNTTLSNLTIAEDFRTDGVAINLNIGGNKVLEAHALYFDSHRKNISLSFTLWTVENTNTNGFSSKSTDVFSDTNYSIKLVDLVKKNTKLLNSINDKIKHIDINTLYSLYKNKDVDKLKELIINS